MLTISSIKTNKKIPINGDFYKHFLSNKLTIIAFYPFLTNSKSQNHHPLANK